MPGNLQNSVISYPSPTLVVLFTAPPPLHSKFYLSLSLSLIQDRNAWESSQHKFFLFCYPFLAVPFTAPPLNFIFISLSLSLSHKNTRQDDG
jgi:hypothetical protein